MNDTKTKRTVYLTQCRDYGASLDTAISAGLSAFGGISSLIRKGQKVLIKPNMLTDRSPEEAVTTHPEVVRCLIRKVREAGATPIIADSPSNAVKLERVWEKTGFRRLCDEENIALLNLELAGSTQVDMNGMSFNISKTVLEADFIINVPKVKTHVLTSMTAAVKNMYGTVPGFMKTNLHKSYPTSKEFGKLIATIYEKTKPGLNVADGIYAMEGNGPSGGTRVDLGIIAVSTDAIAMDIVLCRAMGIEPASVTYLKHLCQPSLSTVEQQIEVIPNSWQTLGIRPVRQPSTNVLNLIPGWFARLVRPLIWIRPAIDNKCVKCYQCIKACPAKALIRQNDNKPLLVPDNCIGCCCCHEVCPAKAIEMVHSPLVRMLTGKRKPYDSAKVPR